MTSVRIELQKYSPEDYQSALPSFLKSVNGKICFNERYLIEGGKGEFDTIWDYGNSRNSLRSLVPKGQRITPQQNGRDDITFLGFNNPEITRLMSKVTEVANDPSKSYENPHDRVEYRRYLGDVYLALAHEVKERLQEETLFFPPKNGGIFVEEKFREAKITSPFFDYRLARALAKDTNENTHLCVAAKLGENNPDIADFRNFAVCDDCIASDVSCWATLEMVKDALLISSVSPDNAKVMIVVSAATQRGLESLLSLKACGHFGFKEISAIAAISVYKMTEQFYLQELDGIRYTVGDMGKWTQKI